MARAASPVDTAVALMDAFAARTGLDPGGEPVRYLWTDAFAACNFLHLAGRGGGERFFSLARRTIDQVHTHLGHFRPDDRRTGWLRGPHGSAGPDHPTSAGLRIGKPLPERAPGEPMDERLEWDRDGQYFHYLARWIQALERLAVPLGDPRLHRWACELAGVSHRAFTHHGPDGRPRMYWKMSTDLSRPLVASMGQHDALDGLLATLVLQAGNDAGAGAAPDLRQAMQGFAAMVEPDALATADLLGVGGLLMDGLRLDHLVREGAEVLAPLRDRVLDGALAGLQHTRFQAQAPADTRLGFRELGLAIGLAGIPALGAIGYPRRNALAQFLPLREQINGFWLDPGHRAGATWTGHQDINDVMLATSLVPGSWLS